MMGNGIVCLLIGFLFWSQAASSQSIPAVREVASTASLHAIPSRQTEQTKTSNVAPDAPVITIAGLCDSAPENKAAASNCKTVITQAQFAKVIEAIQPNMPARARREFALHYADALVMAKKAEEVGLDKGANYEEQMKLARIQVLSQDMKKVIQEKVAQISDKDIEDYYRNNIARFEKAEVDRIYVQKTQQPPTVSDRTLSAADRQKRSDESEQTMKEEADNLRARAVEGEAFTKLQMDAYQVAGIKSAIPDTSMAIRRISLPPNQVLVMDLKSGEVSSVLTDPNGYVIYRVKNKYPLPLNQVREEIEGTLHSQRMQDEMQSIEDSATPTIDESYFAQQPH